MSSRLFACVTALLLSTSAFALPAAVVDAVQAPAWRQRGEQSEPLVPGMAVENGDQVRTGDGARVYLNLAEGSTVKLGEKAKLNVYSRSLKPREFFRGALDVLTGAFRFTTAQAAKLKKRELALRVGSATIGIRGTDLWGKSNPDQDLVMLIEGRIEVKAPGGEAVTMSEAMSVFIAPKGAAPLPLAQASGEEFAARAAETELEPSQGALRRRGRVSLLIGDVMDDEATALALYDKVRNAGYGVRIQPLPAEAGWRYQLTLPGFADRKAASQAAPVIGARLALPVRL